MRARAAPRWALLALLPFLIAASDPEGDVVGCTGGAGSGSPDLVEAHGEIVEFGTSAVWELTFAEPLVVPDPVGRPFRVDVAIRDPDVPVQSFAYYRNVNRLVRVDATVGHRTEIYLLPERGTNVFNPPIVEGRLMTIQVPGRILTQDEELTGTSPGLESLRWTVIVRDGRGCDFLGEGQPTQLLATQPSVSPSRGASPEPEPPSDGSGLSPWGMVAGAALALLSIGAYVARRAR
ncbi:MAG: hypothetical protein H0W97_05190 [Actinobacteria bacterium]|nr:hypothetical protein [Actinomycetota bacterium]